MIIITWSCIEYDTRLRIGTYIKFEGVTMHDTKPKFFQSLKENGYMYLRIPDWQMAPEFRGTTFGLFLIQKVKQ